VRIGNGEVGMAPHFLPKAGVAEWEVPCAFMGTDWPPRVRYDCTRAGNKARFVTAQQAARPTIFRMSVKEQIANYIASQPEPKRSDMQELHRVLLQVSPKFKLQFLDGKNSEGKIVSNPNIGYGSYTMKYADGTTREFYQVGMSANTTGISVYILGIDDKTYLAGTYGKTLGKASVTGYCIKFKKLKDINLPVLEAAIRYGLEASGKK
jgi:hypothetical protein